MPKACGCTHPEAGHIGLVDPLTGTKKLVCSEVRCLCTFTYTATPVPGTDAVELWAFEAVPQVVKIWVQDMDPSAEEFVGFISGLVCTGVLHGWIRTGNRETAMADLHGRIFNALVQGGEGQRGDGA